MEVDLRWFIGLCVSAGIFLATVLIGTFRSLSAKISAGDSALHKRVDDVKEKYVRRDDLDKDIQRLDTNMRDMRGEMRDNHQQVLEAISRRAD